MALEVRQEELRRNFLDHYYHLQTPDRSKDHFKYSLNEKGEIYLPTDKNLFSEVERLRKRIYHPFRIRGTASHFMDQAKAQNKFSAKLVTDEWEGDVGSIATYRVPTVEARLSNADFLYMLQMTTTAAVQYGMNHADWDVLLNNSKPLLESITDSRRLIAHDFTGVFDIADALDVGVCYEESLQMREQHRIGYYLGRDLRAFGPRAISQTFDISEQSGYENIRLWNRSVGPFRESRFQPEDNIADYSPFYIRVTKQDLSDVIDRIETKDTHDRSLAFFVSQGAGDGRGYLKDSVNYLLAEKVTLELLEKLKSWEHNNDDQLTFSH